ncbi:PREDICTED: C-type mannose receptor 2-like [Cyprinodon variegatus]|uniref:C-type mannose receptor 2-like n=1 Tax=Cyprinodon variegatus TaxID=28743 RepID=UPI0007427CCA|nr:PREDICTED: C-type mannose receptor 2-like [Cyprinodon variegatus]
MVSQLYDYLYINEEKTWTEAQQYCRENHTDLATVSNMTDMKRLLSTRAGHIKEAWIGLYDQTDGDRTWYWSLPGVEFNESETNWNKNEPNNVKATQNCGIIWRDRKWGDESCNKHFYYLCYNDKVILVKEKMNWEDALYYCRDHYHDLVTITSLDEQRWIQEKAKNASTDYVWMGLRYTCTLDFWFWVSDEVVRYKNWASGEPVDDCDMSGAMETGGGHKWRKINDLEEFNFLCSKS